jgi:hypothetical protein
MNPAVMIPTAATPKKTESLGQTGAGTQTEPIERQGIGQPAQVREQRGHNDLLMT